MGPDESRWTAGRHALERLAAVLGRPGGEESLAALSDIGGLRRLLDETELEAVRGARRAGKSWAEIAIKLGITRQSAWERWRDIDREPGTPAALLSRLDDPEQAPHTEGAVGGYDRASIVVPNVVGVSFSDAQATLNRVGLRGVPADPEDEVLYLGHAVTVTDQSPESGARALPGALVRLWIERGGGAGVREPRRPHPSLRIEHERLDEPSRDALG